MGFFSSIGKALGSIGNAIGGILGGGAGALFSAGGSLLGGLLGGKTLTGSPGGISVVTPPNVDKAVGIVNSLLNQVPTISTNYSNIMGNYLQKAEDSFTQLPGVLRSYANTSKSEINNIYQNLLSSAQNVYQSEWEKSRQALGLAGMLNTPALLQTQTDLMNKLQYDVLSNKAQTDTNIETSLLSSLMKLASAQPDFYLSIGREKAQIDPTLKQFDLQLGLAQTLMGAPYKIIETPPQKGILSDILQTIGNVPASTWRDIGNSISSIFNRPSTIQFDTTFSVPPIRSWGDFFPTKPMI